MRSTLFYIAAVSKQGISRNKKIIRDRNNNTDDGYKIYNIQ